MKNIAAGEINPLSRLPSQTPNAGVDGTNQWYIFSVESQLVIFSHWALVGTTTGQFNVTFNLCNYKALMCNDFVWQSPV